MSTGFWGFSLKRLKHLLIGITLSLLLSGGWTEQAMADYSDAKYRFDNSSFDTKLDIMLGLIATGDYDGLIDYGFTKRFYDAVNAFKSREGLAPDGELSESDISTLKIRSAAFYNSLGLEFYVHPNVNSKLFVPKSIFDQQMPTPHGLAFERKDQNLSLSFVFYNKDEKTFLQLFDSMTRESPKRKVAYRKLRDNYFVSSGIFNNRNFYTWMSAIQDGSVGFTLSWKSESADIGSKLSILMANTFVAEVKSVSAPPTSPPNDSKEQEKPTSGTGTGFKVSSEGHVLTNSHVAGRCNKIFLLKPGEVPISASLVSGDQTNDLALVKADRYLGGTVANFSSGPLPRAGSDIVVYGFPLAGTLSKSGNIVTGNITALAGLGDDSRMFQISAPVQPGNSGGPVLDNRGSVIAIVVSKLNVLEMAKLNGDISQNVNFAIKANIATNFLAGVGIKYIAESPTAVLDTPTIAERAQNFTYLVECQN